MVNNDIEIRHFDQTYYQTAYFSQLIADIKKGEVKIPQFQRKFVWKDEQALEQLDCLMATRLVASFLEDSRQA